MLLVQEAAVPTLDRMAAAVRSHHAVSGTLRSPTVGALRFRFLAPGYASIEGKPIGGRVVTDGSTAWVAYDAGKVYYRIDPEKVYATANAIVGYNLLLQTPAIDYLELLQTNVADGRGGAMGIDVRIPTTPRKYRGGMSPPDVAAISFFVMSPSPDYPRRMEIVVDPTTGLPRGIRTAADRVLKPEEYRYENIVLDPALSPADFPFAPPPGYRDGYLPAHPLLARTPRLGLAFPDFEAGVGVWTSGKRPPLRMGPTVRSNGGNWVFDVETTRPGGYDWQRARIFARFGKDWRIGTAIIKGDRVVILVPKAGSSARPDALQLGIGTAVREFSYSFYWKKT